MAEVLGFMLGVWSLWTAQAWWQAYRRPQLEQRAATARRRQVIVTSRRVEA